MKAKTLISFIEEDLLVRNFPVIKAISPQIGLSGMSLKEAKDYFYGTQGLNMYQVVITTLGKEYQDFYGEGK